MFNIIRKIIIKISRLLKFSSYFLKRLKGKVNPELEINIILILRNSFIPSGKKYIFSPRGYFLGHRKKLEIIDDVKKFPNILWNNHTA